MSLGLVGLNHRSAPVEIRERFYLDEAEAVDVARRLRGEAALEECLLLCTCNRTECYFTAPHAEEAMERIVEALAARAGFPPEEAARYFVALRGREVARHLYRVTAGLDSLVVGEPQIQGQVRSAYRAGHDATPRVVGPVLHRLFQTALATGGRVRSETRIAEGTASVPSAAVELAEKVLGSLEGRSALVIGAGKMGTLTLGCLRSAGVRELRLTSRTLERARSAAGAGGDIEAIPYREVKSRLGGADVIVTSAAAPHPILTAEALSGGRPPGSPLVILDIAVPRNVTPEVGDLPGIFLYNIDDLYRVVRTAMELRASHLPPAEEIVHEDAAAFWEWYRSRRAVPLIREIRRRAETLVRREMEAALAGLGELSEEQRQRIELASRAALNKILHGPTTALREWAGREDGEELLRAARRLFGLDGITEEEVREGDGGDG